MTATATTWSFAPLVASPTETCTICLDTKNETEFPNRTLTTHCTHKRSTCVDCVKSCVTFDINNKSLSEIACPECEFRLDAEIIREYADDDHWERYNMLCLRDLLEREEGFVWCAAGCGNGQIHDGGVYQPIVKCTSCGQRTCFQHQAPWHGGLTCEEWDDLIRNEPIQGTHETIESRIKARRDSKASEETINKISKPCPGCGRSIEKNGGW
ncbi:hypothetical protein QBC34DRAFT_340699 [Podospora aff. communis PSN243]|uniref:RBR-type E3 ubiquitin transferase n=1 Tax=Podospora aff. communis PSN243 TaxID=3040156 RepID=A0AAV9H356_9PEZI|nr:hypothetical protein QBC34DRAFT_340699 [Podospora aff. communis PSN243]